MLEPAKLERAGLGRARLGRIAIQFLRFQSWISNYEFIQPWIQSWIQSWARSRSFVTDNHTNGSIHMHVLRFDIDNTHTFCAKVVAMLFFVSHTQLSL